MKRLIQWNYWSMNGHTYFGWVIEKWDASKKLIHPRQWKYPTKDCYQEAASTQEETLQRIRYYYKEALLI